MSTSTSISVKVDIDIEVDFNVGRCRLLTTRQARSWGPRRCAGLSPNGAPPTPAASILRALRVAFAVSCARRRRCHGSCAGGGKRPAHLRGAGEEMAMTNDQLLPFQRLDVYIVAKEFARRIHEAKISDAALRDQATRAAKSAFLHICEGLPNRGTAMRRKYFTGSQNRLYEALGAMDLARAIGAVSQEDADAVQALGVRFAQLLSALLR